MSSRPLSFNTTFKIEAGLLRVWFHLMGIANQYLNFSVITYTIIVEIALCDGPVWRRKLEFPTFFSKAHWAAATYASVSVAVAPISLTVSGGGWQSAPQPAFWNLNIAVVLCHCIVCWRDRDSKDRRRRQPRLHRLPGFAAMLPRRPQRGSAVLPYRLILYNL